MKIVNRIIATQNRETSFLPLLILCTMFLSGSRRLQTLANKSVPVWVASQQRNISKVTVIGAGLMGSGIAQVAAQADYKVTMVDTTDAALQNGQNIIASSIKRVARKKFAEDTKQQDAFIEKAIANIITSKDAEEAASTADLVIEAIVENIDIKQKLFKGLDKAAPSSTIFATNTSSLPVTKIADATSLDRQKRFAGLHFFNPVPAMKLVEVIRTEKLEDGVFQALVEFSKKTGKTPVECKDTPG